MPGPVTGSTQQSTETTAAAADTAAALAAGPSAEPSDRSPATPSTPDDATADPELDSPYWRIEAPSTRQSLWTTIRALPATTRPIVSVVWQAAPGSVVTILLLQILSGVATAFGLLNTTDVLSSLLAAGPSAERVAAALPALALVVGAYAVRGALDAGAGLAEAAVAPKAHRLAEERLCAAALSVELPAFDDAAFHDRMHRARDRGLFHLEQAAASLVELVGAVFALAACSASLGVLHPVLIPVLLLSLGPEAWAVVRVARLGYDGMARSVSLIRRVRMMSDLATDRTAAAEIRACQAEGFVLDEYRTVADAALRLDVTIARAQARIRTVGRTLAGIAMGFLLLVLGLLLDAGWIPLAAGGTALIAVRLAAAALTRLVVAANQLLEQGLYVSDYQSFLAEAAIRARPARPHAPAPAGPGRITVENVDFHYPGRAAHPALSSIDLTIPPGHTIALVGENGSGKTTLAKLVAGLYRPTAGRVCWDGVDLRDLDPASVADRLVMVLQEPVRWPHDARTNVRVGRPGRADPGDTVLHEAARRSGADAVIAGLPNGWRTLLSRQFRGGQDLSGGQWQRLAIARGLYRDAPLLIWDEPTAPLDAKAEHAVYESLRRIAHGRTVILITHRLPSVRNADRIYLLHEGRIAEQGTHGELLAAGGQYAEMFALQEVPVAHR